MHVSDSGGRAVAGGTLFGALFLCLAVTTMQIVHDLKIMLIEKKINVGDRIPNEYELSELETNAGTEKLVKLDLDFHIILAEADGNMMLKNVYENMIGICIIK